MTTTQNYWRKCSSCKKDIPLNSTYYECSVSTCTGQRTGYVFCTVGCWEVHLPGAKHRDAGAVEKRSPSVAAPAEVEPVAPRRIIVNSASASIAQTSVSVKSGPNSMNHEVLVVVSKMKQYIREASEMNTSEDVNQMLSEMIRKECDRAIQKAKASGRKTVMARDFTG